MKVDAPVRIILGPLPQQDCQVLLPDGTDLVKVARITRIEIEPVDARRSEMLNATIVLTGVEVDAHVLASIEHSPASSIRIDEAAT